MLKTNTLMAVIGLALASLAATPVSAGHEVDTPRLD